ncbi:MAG: histone deacetylase [Bacteroidota bacterium]
MTLYSLRDDHALHASRGHPERPARLHAVRDLLRRDGALRDLVHVSAEAASLDTLALVHDPAYLDALDTFCETGGGMLDVDTYATPDSWRIAREACGDLLGIVDRVCSGEATNGFALGRPPGHHARPAQAMGFCLLANVAIAARHAQRVHGLDRVLVLDFDVHHGNGTQESLYEDPSVLVVSSHQADIYPGSGRLGETGDEAGEGATVNLPVPGGTGDAGMRSLYREIVAPLADRFRPELVLVSAGYDAHRLDPLGGLALSVSGLTDLVRLAMEIADRHADGRIVLSLEGGYDTDMLAHGVASSLRALRNPTAEALDPFGPSRHTGPDLLDLAEALRQQHGL